MVSFTITVESELWVVGYKDTGRAIGWFTNELVAARFIDTLPDFKLGIYYLERQYPTPGVDKSRRA